MIRVSTQRPFCVLGWALLILVPSLVITAVALPIMVRLDRMESAIEERRDQIQKYRRLIATLPSLRAELEQVKANEDFKAFYFDAPTPALAGAELQRKVQDIVTAASGRLISTQLLPDEKEQHPPRVRIRTQIQGSTETLINILYEIEQARPFLFVDQVSVRSSARADLPERLTRARAARSGVDPQAELTVRLDIFGFALGGGP
ncbi:MAG: type II secretion system protein GspM [Bdellovibrio bacteriovorus]